MKNKLILSVLFTLSSLTFAQDSEEVIYGFKFGLQKGLNAKMLKGMEEKLKNLIEERMLHIQCTPFAIERGLLRGAFNV